MSAMEKELKESISAADRAKAVDLAWRTGRLRYKLDSLQRKCYDAIEATVGGSFYFNKARRVGGSYLLTVRAVEQCLRKPNAQIRYAAPTAKALRKIVQPNLRKVLHDCPAGLRPKWSTLEQEYRFPNGSTMALSGCDAQRYEDLRGTEADEIYMDEVGFIDELDYILDDILLPQVQDTGGRVILVSTPPRSPSHPACKLAAKHEAAGRYFACTVWDSPRLTRDQKEAYFRRLARDLTLEEYYRTTTFRREYLAEFITDETRAVIPEWTKERQDICIREVQEPEHFDGYVGIDLGWRDGTAAVFGYWDYKHARLVIQDELLRFRTPIDEFQRLAVEKEDKLWGIKRPLLRVCDNDDVVIREMNRRGWTVRATAKDNKEMAINMLRELVRDCRLFVHPRCKRLVSQLHSTIWDEKHHAFERNEDGHGDLLDALIYMNRCVMRSKDPNANLVVSDAWDTFRWYAKEERKGSQLSERLLAHLDRMDIGEA